VTAEADYHGETGLLYNHRISAVTAVHADGLND